MSTRRASRDSQLDLHRARAAVDDAWLAESAAERYLAAQAVALRVAAVLLAVGRPGSGRRPRPRNAWRVVAEVAPGFADWAACFAVSQARCDVLRAGATAIVGAHEADGLLRDAERFLDVVEEALGCPSSQPRQLRFRYG